jgi:hypothetical protein
MKKNRDSTSQKREEVVPRYKYASPPYYQEEHENEKLEERAQNFEPRIPNVVEQEATTQGIKLSKQVELVLVIRKIYIILPRVKPTIGEGIIAVIKIRYNEPRFNQQSVRIVRRVLRDWSRRIHSVNIIPRPNPP